MVVLPISMETTKDNNLDRVTTIVYVFSPAMNKSLEHGLSPMTNDLTVFIEELIDTALHFRVRLTLSCYQNQGKNMDYWCKYASYLYQKNVI